MTFNRVRTWIATAAVIALATGAAAACDAPGGAARMGDAIVSWINESRQAKGLSSLRVSQALQASASAHACDMAKRSYFAHEGPGGPSFSRRLKKAGYKFRAANENIARTHAASADAAIEIWRKSPPHWANVLDPKVREVGVGIAEAGGRVYWVTNSGSN